MQQIIDIVNGSIVNKDWQPKITLFLLTTTTTTKVLIEILQLKLLCKNSIFFRFYAHPFFLSILRMMCILVLSGIELILFIASSTELQFWIYDGNSVYSTGMFLLPLSGADRESKPFFFSHHTTSDQAGGCARDWKRTRVEHRILHDQRHIPYHMTSYSAYKIQGRRRKRERFKMVTFVFATNCYMWWSPALLEMAQEIPADRRWWINSLVCFACMCGFYFTY